MTRMLSIVVDNHFLRAFTGFVSNQKLNQLLYIFATVGILILQQEENRYRTIVCYTFMMMEIYFNPFLPVMHSEKRH